MANFDNFPRPDHDPQGEVHTEPKSETVVALGQTGLIKFAQEPSAIELNESKDNDVEFNFKRAGRLNDTSIIDATTIRKYGRIVENIRPYRLLNEAWGLQTAHQRGVNTPTVKSYSRSPDGHETLEMERIPGSSLDKITDERGRTHCMHEVGTQLSRLGNVSTGFGWIDPERRVGAYDSWTHYIADYTASYVQLLIHAGLIDQAEADKLLSRVRSTEFNIERPSLVHRDIKWGNLILSNTGAVYLIDWENIIFGDSMYDVAIFGVREGHGEPWKAFASGLGVDTESLQYVLYESIALVGIVEYHRQYESNAPEKAAKLKQLIAQL